MMPDTARFTRRAVAALAALLAALARPASGHAQDPRPLLPIPFERSAEYRWLQKPVLARRALDDMTDPSTWRFSGTGTLTAPATRGPGGGAVLRVDVRMFTDAPAPTRSRLSTVNLRREFPGEDWSAFNRLSLWIRPTVRGFPMLPLQLVLHNEGRDTVPDRYYREGIHYVTLAPGGWQQVVWEIDPLARDRVTALEIGYWVNKMLAAPGDTIAFELAGLELQRVEPDHHTGWAVAPGQVAVSTVGYRTGLPKTALASDLDASRFQLLRVNDVALGELVLDGPVETVHTRLGDFQQLDFSAVNRPGRYVLRAGARLTTPFTIGDDVWTGTIRDVLNFFYGERCGFPVPGSHGIDHTDWFATHGEARIPMSGGWHDAGDLSQGVINTGEATYALFDLADRLRARGDDPALVARVLEEARWGLDWVLRVRFDGGYRIAFASHNLWTDGIVGTADDRTREAKNNPNANYIAAAAEAIAARVLRDSDPALAARSLRVAEDDWRYALAGVEADSTRHTPAFAATPIELAGIGITASLELYRATGRREFADTAAALARVITASQQTVPVGDALPLSGFFYTGPDRDTLFHQFHRGNDQAPVVALAQLVERLPAHHDWMTWYAALARWAAYQRRVSGTTAPYEVLPAYVYREADTLEVPEAGALHLATRSSYLAQVRAGTPMGGGWYLRDFPVWFARRGNFGILLSQAKGLAVASRLRGDSAGLALAARQAEWLAGRNPFAQSFIYGVGDGWSQQYSVSSGDFVGAIPVGMQSRGETDLPYWPTQNTYVYKEVWIHSASRWLWLMADLLDGPAAGDAAGAPPPDLRVEPAVVRAGVVTIRAVLRGSGTQRVTLRADGLDVATPTRVVRLRAGRPQTVEWNARPRDPGATWVALVVPDDDLHRAREIIAPLE